MFDVVLLPSPASSPLVRGKWTRKEDGSLDTVCPADPCPAVTTLDLKTLRSGTMWTIRGTCPACRRAFTAALVGFPGGA